LKKMTAAFAFRTNAAVFLCVLPINVPKGNS
jgi:hypothetical protein